MPARRFGYLTAGGRPGDLSPEFLAARSHYSYFEITAPQPKRVLDLIRSTIRGVALFFYSDVFYPAWRGMANVTPWPRGLDWAPPKDHLGWIRDLDGNIIPRFGRGLFLPRESVASQDRVLGPDPIRKIAACHRGLCDLMDAGARFDNLSPTIGWDLGGHERVFWYGQLKSREEIAAAYERIAKRTVDALAAALGPRPMIASSSERWPGAQSKKLVGRLRERGIVAATFAGSPLRTDVPSMNLALCYPDTVDQVCATFRNPRLQPSVVIVEHHDLGGRVLGAS